MFIQIVFMFLLGVVCTPFTNAQPSFEAFLRSMGHGGGGMQFPSRPSFPEMIDMTSSAGSGSCPYQSHPNKLKFNQMVNNRMITQDCAPGTMFDLSKCSCVNAPSAAPGGGPPVGGDPRMSATGDPNFSQMMSMLQSLGGGSGTPFPSSMDIQPPQMSVPFNPMQMPGLAMPRGLTLDIGTSSADQTLANPIQYKPMPAGTKANSLVDPALLPDVIPPEVMLLLQQAQVAKSREIGKTNGRFLTSKVAVTTTTPSSMGNQDRVNQVHEQSLTGQLPPAVLQMLQQASSPTAHGSARNKETSGDSPVLPQSVLKHLNDISPASFNQALAPHESGGIHLTLLRHSFSAHSRLFHRLQPLPLVDRIWRP
ncbi:hypothetical protein DPMN_059676 [Dreissena polymorpha]|uniref:Uncharacterized protein n=1 Tax=Dreissena polymorpha TaxID=45954 RepID=A0A9D4HFA8_DREPO|nr:hypothetical protein DPMN_059676 [Dreissena polymorpha]